MLILAVIAGFIISTISFSLGFYFSLFCGPTQKEITIPTLFKKNTRRKPKSVSEEEQWRKEQKEPPLSPSFEP